MAVLSQYDYIFALTTIFAFLDAWNIGANDVANSFATSVSSRSLTMKQAMAIASVMEFSGSVAVGSRVADTIRTKIIDPELFESQPAILMLAMMCALIGSSTFLTIATRYGLPISTTHSIIGGIVGAGTASVGIRNINWGYRGVSQVFVAWAVAPGISGAMGAALFLITKYFVMTRQNAVVKAFISIPIYTFITIGALTMLIVWKGIQLNTALTGAEIAICVLTVATGVTALECLFLLPYLWQKIMHEDWQLRWYRGWQGPYLLKRPQAPPAPRGTTSLNIKDYYQGHLTTEELECLRASESLLQSIQSSKSSTDLEKSYYTPSTTATATSTTIDGISPRPAGPWYTLPVLYWKAKRILFHGLEQDVIRMQKRTNTFVKWNIADMHARAPRYDNRAEHMYSFLQVLTAAAASFIHGANDVSNAIAPLSTAYLIWQTGHIQPTAPVPIWVLCFGGVAIVIGLLTYGYQVMRNLGNRLTLMTPSRGFCMELGSAITVLMATRLALPVSTTQCIAGAAIGVGLANGDWKAINLRLIGWIYFGWVITVPITALISGSIMALIINAPRWDSPT